MSTKTNPTAEGVVALHFGPASIDWIGKASKLCGRDAVMSPDVARMAGANLAAGTPAALDALRAKLAAGSIEAERTQTRGLGLPTGAAEWLGAGERGISSETIFSHLTGLDVLRNHRGGHPHDPDDWRCCELLLEAVPALRESFARMREQGAVWSALVDRWADIRATMDAECPGWRDPASHWVASQTYDLMKNIINAARAA